MNATAIIGYTVESTVFCAECAEYSDKYGQDSVIDHGHPVFALPDNMDMTCDHCMTELGE